MAVTVPTATAPAPLDIAELRATKYNATLLDWREASPGLRVFRVEPDEPLGDFLPGQYVPLGLGYWEPRGDDLDDGIAERRRSSLVTRSYSISCPIVERGRMSNPVGRPYIEFYIALVDPVPGDRPPRLTPRLWQCEPGDRLFLGPNVVGRYTLEPVGSTDNVLLLATGTGEAPHNGMVAELARRGHQGRVTALSTARHRADFAYRDNHRALEDLWGNYSYLALSTREPVDGVKRYIQDVLAGPDPDQWVGFDLDPEHTHVFLCGNPAMVGLPEWDDDGEPVFPDEVGATQILHERGFTLDGKDRVGNVHFEAYW